MHFATVLTLRGTNKLVGYKAQCMSAELPVLEISGYSPSYNTPSGPLRALKNVNLSVARGQTHGLVGESGSGKSSLAWAILRYLPDNAIENDGKLLLSGESLRDRTPSQIIEVRGQRISMVFQDPSTSLNPAMRLGEQLSEVMIRHRGLTPREATEASEQALERTGITKPKEMLERYPHQASGGEKQRVVIATAFACNPELIIFDEPTTALDIITAQQILDLFNQLQDETSISALYISHDLGLVSRVADTVSVLKAGEVVESGLRTDIFMSPRDDYTKKLLSAVPDPKHWLGVNAPAPELPILMSAENITVEYGRQSVIGRLFAPKPTHIGAHEVCLNVRKGELVGIVGESGSGKSTMAKVLSGLQEFHGVIQFGDTHFSKLDDIDLPYRRAVQIVFQHPDASLNPRQRIGEILSRPLKLYDLTPKEQQTKRIIELLEMVSLPRDYINRFPHQLSGGEKQRVAIARAFAAKPEVVICDEITSSLDVSVQASIANLLVALQDQTGTACLFITHDLNLVRQLAHRICVMQHGELIDTFRPCDAEKPNRNPYTRALLEAVPPPAGQSNMEPIT